MGREDFTRGQAIGHGSYGTVFKVEFHNRKIESRINKAVSAVKRNRFTPLNASLVHDAIKIVINPGVYDFDQTLLISECPGLRVNGAGVTIRSYSSSDTVLHIVASRMLEFESRISNLMSSPLSDEFSCFGHLNSSPLHSFS